MSPTSLKLRYLSVQLLAREAGLLALQYFSNRDQLKIEQKGSQDWVSEADRNVEAFIQERLLTLFPEDGFLGEESGNRNLDAEGIWVVDPIDGTSCFLNGLPSWCVSIAFVVNKKIEMGVIYAPCTDELFSAHIGHEATINGKKMIPSKAALLSEGIVGLGFSPNASIEATEKAMSYLLRNGGVFHRNGSGALTTAYVAAGRYIGFYEEQINSWDCLAGIAMVLEVGGWANNFLDGDGLLQGNPLLVCSPGAKKAMQDLFIAAGHQIPA